MLMVEVAAAYWSRCTLRLMLLLLLALEMTQPVQTRPMSRRYAYGQSRPLLRYAALSDDTTGATVQPGHWLTPCAGATPVEDSLMNAVSGDLSSVDAEDDDLDLSTSTHSRRKLLRRVARQMTRLADRVDRLKQRYADHRFRDDVETLDQLGFHLEGMPDRPDPNTASDDVDQIAVQALADLTRVAPFLEAAIEGERRHERGRHFVMDYRRILNDPEHGFYWVLCQLYRLRTAADAQRAAPEVLTSDSAPPLSSGNVQSNAIRHYRDYVVLRDFGRLLDDYRHLLWRRRAHTGRSKSSRDISQV